MRSGVRIPQGAFSAGQRRTRPPPSIGSRTVPLTRSGSGSGRAAMMCAFVALLSCCVPAASASGAEQGARADGDDVTVVLGLRGDQAGRARFAERVNDPASPAYRRFRSVEWIAARFGASRDARVTVAAALRRRGAHVRVSRTGAFAEATMPAGAAERLLSTRIARPAGRGGFRVQAVPASRLPGPLREHVTAVLVGGAPSGVTAGSTGRTRPRARRSRCRCPSAPGPRGVVRAPWRRRGSRRTSTPARTASIVCTAGACAARACGSPWSTSTGSSGRTS
jgi:hypothetical protein